MAEIRNQTPHVAVFAFPFGSHAAPLLSLVGKLAEELPAATFSFFNTAKSNRSVAGVTAKLCEITKNVRIYDVWDGVPEGYVWEGRPQEEIELFLAVMARSFREGLARAEDAGGGKATVVVSDTFVWSAAELATEREAPWVSLWTSGTFALVAHFYTERIRQVIGVRAEGNRLKTFEISVGLDKHLDFIPGLTLLQARDLPEGILVGNLNSTFAQMLISMAKISPRADAIVFNSFDGLDPSILDHLKTIYTKCLTVGPLPLLAPSLPSPDVHGCLPWLDHLQPTIYISFGTFLSPPPSELAAIAEGLEASGVHFLWSLKDSFRASLPQGFLERTKGRGLVVPWVPQTAVLGHTAVAAFMTHCGWNSVMESVMEGVPLICRPFFADQRLNSRMVSHVWRVGLQAEGGVLTKDGTMRALDVIMGKGEGREMKKRIDDLKEMAIGAVGEEEISKLFPQLFGQPSALLVLTGSVPSQLYQNLKIGVVLSGGPAPCSFQLLLPNPSSHSPSTSYSLERFRPVNTSNSNLRQMGVGL